MNQLVESKIELNFETNQYKKKSSFSTARNLSGIWTDIHQDSHGKNTYRAKPNVK